MNTTYKVKNFRIFDEEGVDVDLRPITILTGCNNSGKSSIVKSLCLLKDFCDQLNADFENGHDLKLENYKIDFHKAPNDIMGTFDSVLHRKESKKKGKEAPADEKQYITFEITVESAWLLQDVIVVLKFCAFDGDDLNNGYLHYYSIRTLDDKLIYEATYGSEAIMDFSHIKKNILLFFYHQFAIQKWQDEYLWQTIEGTEVIENDEDDPWIHYTISEDNIQNNLGDRELLRSLEWRFSNYVKPWIPSNIFRHEQLNSSFINSPLLGVYFYYPCLSKLQEHPKDELIKHIQNTIDKSEDKVTEIEAKIVSVFLEAFKNSEHSSLHEYISSKENERFFSDKIIPLYSRDKFPWPVDNHIFKQLSKRSLQRLSQLPSSTNSWQLIITAMDIINKLVMDTSKSLLYVDTTGNYNNHFLGNHINKILESVIKDIFANLLPGGLSYSGTSMVLPRRLYSLEDRNETSATLNRFFEVKRKWSSIKRANPHLNSIQFSDMTFPEYEPLSFTNKWLNKLDIADRVELIYHADGYGISIRLFKDKEDEKDTKGMLLVDKGYGVIQLFMFLLKIEIAIMESMTYETKYPYNIYGFDEKILESLRTPQQLHPETVALEEPENHLHPSMQSHIADIVCDAYTQYGIHFLIESHSEYFIRKLQLLISQKELNHDAVSLLYVNSPTRPEYIPLITDIGIKSDGTLKNEFGIGFFDESFRLSKELFSNKNNDDDEN